MSELVHASRGGEFATSRRGSIAADLDFILDQKGRGRSAAVVARMIGRSLPDVQKIYEASEYHACERETKARVEVAAREAERRAMVGRTAAVVASDRRRIGLPSGARRVVQRVADHYGVTIAEIVTDDTSKRISHIRQECFWALYQTGRYSLPQIGVWMGGRDHTTVLSGIRRHEARLAEAQLSEAA